MAEAALFGIATSILQQLALDEFRLLWGHNEQLDKLNDTITSIGDVLEDADRRQATDVSVQRWVARLRTALYEADDVFDKISAKVLQDKEKTGTKIGKKVRNFAFFVKNAHKVKAIREHFDGIARDMNQFSFLVVETTQHDQPFAMRREQTHSYVPKNEVVGREREREEIVRLLLLLPREQRGVSVVAVIGIGGLGKTTLAQLVYNDERVQQGFDMCLWACVHYLSDLKQVLVALLKSTTKSDDLDQLQSKFREKIEGKRFLLVLDDVWDESTRNWYKLKMLLDSGEDGSMVLATTRSLKVAESLDATEANCYHLPYMSNESAWLLFKKIAFGEKDGQSSSLDLEQFGQQIVEKCPKVPLAIVTIASLLRHKDKKKWLPFVSDELSKVEPDELKKITSVLKLSYNELQYPVKRCFAYCSLFPKDYEFEKGTLVRLWIAQGFVEPYVVSQSLEDRAEEYFFCLVDRCFFQDRKTSVIKGVTRDTYKMHDLMLDLAKEVARFESSLVDQIAHNNSWDKTLCHVSLNCQSEDLVDRVCSFSHSKSLRTFLWLNKIPMEQIALEKLVACFKALRVLDLSHLGIKEIPASIGKLIHLRFLDLSGNDMERIPTSICSLRHLQSLILQGCRSLKELPKDLEKLLSLRHLVLEGCAKLSEMPPGLARLKSLVTLDRLVVHNPRGGLSYLECLDYLSGSLDIELPLAGWNNATTDAERSCLSRKSRLERLAIKWKSETDEEVMTLTVIDALKPHPNLEHLSILRFNGNEIPPWVTSLHNLVILKLESCLRCVKLPPLSHLPSLKELYIDNMPSVLAIEDNELHNPDLFFPSLETLWIWNMPRLSSWWLQAPTVLPTFPRVTKVNIRNCYKLTTCLPLFPLLDHLKLEKVQTVLIGLTSYKGNALKRLRLASIRGLSSIAKAQTRHLSNLKKLSIYRCEQLKTVSCVGLLYLTSLEKLKITECKNLEWVDVNDQKPMDPWGNLPRLKYLEIPSVNANIFKGFNHLNSLQVLKIYNLHKEFHLVKGVEQLTSLQVLTLTDCKELYLSWRVLLSLGRLQILTFSSVERVIDVDPTEVQTQQVSNLRELKMYGCYAEWIHCIPWKLFPSLQYLHLSKIHNLGGLPEGIRHLSGLQQLKIMVCQSVASLPHWMRYLGCLRYVEIRRSSEELKKRCEKQSGEDWPNIQHIQEVIITT